MQYSCNEVLLFCLVHDCWAFYDDKRCVCFELVYLVRDCCVYACRELWHCGGGVSRVFGFGLAKWTLVWGEFCSGFDFGFCCVICI